jgi:hypothetical protein
MSTQPMNQNDPQAIELRIRTLRTVWIALLLSIAGYFVLTIFQKPSANIPPNPTLSLILLLVGISTTLISFLIRNKLLTRAVDQQQVPMVQQAYVLAWAVNEVAALLGVVDFFVTGHRHYYILLIVSVCGLLLHFPRRESVVNAASWNVL